MKKLTSICILLVMLCCLSSCGEDYIQGEELFHLSQYLTHIEIRHNGQGQFYVNSNGGLTGADGMKLATYNRLLKGLALTPTNREGTLDRSIYEISFSSTIWEEGTYDIIETLHIRIVISGELVWYNDQWYEANTTWLLRQLERDFSD